MADNEFWAGFSLPTTSRAQVSANASTPTGKRGTYNDGTYNVRVRATDAQLHSAIGQILSTGNLDILSLNEVSYKRHKKVVRQEARKHGYDVYFLNTMNPILVKKGGSLKVKEGSGKTIKYAEAGPGHSARSANRLKLLNPDSGKTIKYFGTHIEHSYSRPGTRKYRSTKAKEMLLDLTRRARNTQRNSPDTVVRIGGDMNANLNNRSKSWYPGAGLRNELSQMVGVNIDQIYYSDNAKVGKANSRRFAGGDHPFVWTTVRL